MSKRNSTARTRFEYMCMSRNLDKNTLLKKTKLLLKCYQDICWSDETCRQMFIDDYGNFCLANPDFVHAMDYLESFDPDTERHLFVEKISTLFEKQWMIELVDSAMIRVREFPRIGQTYYTILSDCYMSHADFKESDMLNLLNFERSIYYDRKREATMVFAVALWDRAIPKMRDLISNPEFDSSDWQEGIIEERKDAV